MMKKVLTIILNIIIVLLIIVFIYVGFMVFKAYSEDNADISQFINPAYFLSLVNFYQEDKWVTYESLTYSFEHPANWKPAAQSSQQNSIEIVDLKIPAIFSLPRLGGTTMLGYFRDPVTKIRPANILKEGSIVFANRQGYKWIYKQENNYYMYIYAIPLSTNQTSLRQASTFVIMVEAVRQDEDLEKLLDRMAQSITFKEM